MAVRLSGKAIHGRSERDLLSERLPLVAFPEIWVHLAAISLRERYS